MEKKTNGDADLSNLCSVFEIVSDERKVDKSEHPGLDAMKARAKELEAEIERLKELQKLKEVQSEAKRIMDQRSANSSIRRGPSLQKVNVSAAAVNVSDEEKADADARSVYIGNVDYSATADELESHFLGCGPVNRVTILCDKYTGHPKGFAYVEFADKDSVRMATALNDSLFKGRQIKVNPKRTNVPGISSTNRFPRGRGGTRGYASGSYNRPYRGRGASRSRRGSYYSPY